MREIKFRAWHKEKKYMKYDDIYPDGKRDWAGWEQSFDCMIHVMQMDFELMQFTGLKDKNGKEIYEGDIIEYAVQDDGGGWDVCRGSVEFTDCAFQVRLVDGCDFNGLYEFLCDWDKCEVIGNIHENPELLKG